jgi:hypothetical protein
MQEPLEPGISTPPDDGIGADYGPEVLAALDAWEPPSLDAPTLPTRLVSWRRTSLVGAVMTGMAFGLREVLEVDRRDQVVIEVDADDELDDGPIALRLDLDDPANSWCVVRRTGR